MKKTITIIIGLFAIMWFSGSVYAAAITWNNGTTGGTAVTIGSGTTSLSFDASPGVMISGGNDITTYCIITGNAKAGSNAIAYAVASGSGEVGQDAIDLSTPAVATLGTPTTNGTLPASFSTK